MGDWKGIRLNMSSNPDAPIALYDLSVDHNESFDVSNQNPSIMGKINTIMGREHILSHEFKFESEDQNDQVKNSKNVYN